MGGWGDGEMGRWGDEGDKGDKGDGVEKNNNFPVTSHQSTVNSQHSNAIRLKYQSITKTAEPPEILRLRRASKA
ncbi:hypothetical protein VF08_36915 [Nostoc linckia z8]|uniref:Uncharacterized protein n=1 Tax=Nostoc linckia z8 TaxID=1628746 RepID=A0A9Q5Z4C7_NOSLI|nr:hypothetical protein VF08_36915 [Nostoc linckia z8]